MPKMTAKYSAAYSLARREKITLTDNQEQLYSQLQELGYYWDSDRKEFVWHDPNEADDPTQLIMIRVWADAEIVEDVADDVARSVPKSWGKPIKRNGPYPCRPPHQRDARMYLEFLPKPKKGVNNQ